MHALASSLRSISRYLHDLFIENVNLLLAVFLICAIGTLLLQLPAPSTIFAQGGEEESGDAGAVFFIRNPGFEQQTNGNHFVPWGRFPKNADVYAENTAPHNGSWNGAMEPHGALTTQRQKVQVNAGNLYELKAWASTSHGDLGHPANLIWFSNVTGDRTCAYSTATWNTYSFLKCTLEVPVGTTVFRVKLKSDAPDPQWLVNDDWEILDRGDPNNLAYAQAFAIFQGPLITGVKADVWTATPPGNFWAIGSPVGICSHTPCDGQVGFYETGYTKGLTTGGQMKQYVTWENVNGAGDSVIVANNPNLNENQSYNFEVSFNAGTGKWEAKRDGVLKHDMSLDFNSGGEAICGAEGIDLIPPVDPPLAVQCNSMSYRNAAGAWQQYNYNATRTIRNYCVTRLNPFGAIGWGIC